MSRAYAGASSSLVNERCQARLSGDDFRWPYEVTCSPSKGSLAALLLVTRPPRASHLPSLGLGPRPELGEAASQHPRNLHLSGAYEGPDLGLGPARHEAQVDHQALSLGEAGQQRV